MRALFQFKPSWGFFSGSYCDFESRAQCNSVTFNCFFVAIKYITFLFVLCVRLLCARANVCMCVFLCCCMLCASERVYVYFFVRTVVCCARANVCMCVFVCCCMLYASKCVYVVWLCVCVCVCVSVLHTQLVTFSHRISVSTFFCDTRLIQTSGL